MTSLSTSLMTAAIISVATLFSGIGVGAFWASVFGTHSYKARARAAAVGLLGGFVMLWCQTWLVTRGGF